MLATSKHLLDLIAANAPPDTTTVPPMLMGLFRPSVRPYMISWFKYDPAVEISKLKVPALIPDVYISDIRIRLSYYKALSEISSHEELDRIELETT